VIIVKIALDFRRRWAWHAIPDRASQPPLDQVARRAEDPIVKGQ
jgi:hypothetical protein